ncbi:GIN domain-containing protein [Nitratiruptor tergarcus]|uniref:Putative auto-transporter adhesin head GIN domain-containing protein n=1 Tax=Nitratiruptor tergarcus DSM 16512 TaxID=1069081 RepID=A0A1W1WRD4_9BACT|nr:DUF2807 domain-containing protein [Nitratiruptor tergarcus]SMC08775.1 hypothetical protein SAMN05660197_0542 [Nitratiruptor tergarcus DSM 16512]
MYLFTKKINLLAIFLLFIGNTLLFADSNIISNKTIISPGSVVHGNTGIIINGKKVSAPHKQDLAKRIAKNIQCSFDKVVFKIDGMTLHIQNGDKECKIIYPQILKNGLKIAKKTLELKDSKEIAYGAPIDLYIHSIHTISLIGDIFLKVDKKIDTLNLTVQGDADIEFKNAVNTISLDIIGDAQIKLQDVQKATINYSGDLFLEIEKIKTLILKGTGDVIIRPGDEHFTLIKSINGDLHIIKKEKK